MSFGSKALTLLVVAAGGAATVVWPGYIDKHFPGWTARVQPARAMIPAEVLAKIPGAQLAAKPEGPARPTGPRGAEEARRAAVAARPPVPVDIDTVQRGPMPYRIDAVGTVQPIAKVDIKTRADAQVEKILVRDGAAVTKGDVLVQLDARQINAQIRQTEANIQKDKTVAEGAQRDVNRVTELFSRGSGTQLAVDNARTALASARASQAANEALLENQKVQLSWYTLTAPITGRIGTVTAKAGNIIRSGDNTVTGTLATIVQTSPIYVSFSIPQAALAEVREAVARGEGMVTATPQGGTKSATGRVAVLDNAIDAATGTITIRAEFENADEVLWPGQLCNVRVTLRTDPDVVSIPRMATQSGQVGTFVYLVEDGVARVRQVKVSRYQDGRDIIVDGLKGGETIVSDGGLLLANGIRVDVKNKPGQDRKAQDLSAPANKDNI